MSEERPDATAFDLEKAIERAAKVEAGTGPELGPIKLYVLRHLRPVRPMLPTGLFAVLFFVIFAGLALLSTRVMNPLGWSTMLPLQRAAMFTTLAASAGLLAFSMSRQMSPGSPSISPGVLLGGLFTLFCLVAAALFQVRAESNFLKEGQRCLQDGFPYAVPATLLFAWVFRFGARLSSTWSAAITGTLAGLVSTTALEMHCPNQNLSHVLVFHFGIPAFGAMLAAAAVWVRSVTFLRSRRSVGRDVEHLPRE